MAVSVLVFTGFTACWVVLVSVPLPLPPPEWLIVNQIIAPITTTAAAAIPIHFPMPPPASGGACAGVATGGAAGAAAGIRGGAGLSPCPADRTTCIKRDIAGSN